MTSYFLVKALEGDQVPLAFPLLSIVTPGLTKEQWTDYAEALIDQADSTGQCGIVTLQNEQGRIFGLSVYALKPDLHKSRILEVENFVVVDLTSPGRTAKELLEALEEIAQQRGCSCISIGLLDPLSRRSLREPQHPARDLFKAADYRGESMRFRRCF